MTDLRPQLDETDVLAARRGVLYAARRYGARLAAEDIEDLTQNAIGRFLEHAEAGESPLPQRLPVPDRSQLLHRRDASPERRTKRHAPDLLARRVRRSQRCLPGARVCRARGARSAVRSVSCGC